MPTAETHAHREAIRRTLAFHTGGASDSGVIAQATLRTAQLVAARLGPIIGVGGVDVLFRRSLHLISTSYPWLAASSADSPDSATLLASIEGRLTAHPANAATAAAQALLVTFYELLESMLGEALTRRLLAPVWAPASDSSTAENTP